MKNFFNKQFTTFSFKIKSYKHTTKNTIKKIFTITNFLKILNLWLYIYNILKNTWLYLIKIKYYLLFTIISIIDFSLVINFNFSIFYFLWRKMLTEEYIMLIFVIANLIKTLEQILELTLINLIKNNKLNLTKSINKTSYAYVYNYIERLQNLTKSEIFPFYVDETRRLIYIFIFLLKGNTLIYFNVPFF